MTFKTPDWGWQLLPLLIALLALAISAYTGYAANDRETVQRITITEARQVDDRKTLDEIKGDVKDTKAKVVELLIMMGAKR